MVSVRQRSRRQSPPDATQGDCDMLGSLSIGARIYSGFAIILALLGGLAWYTVTSMNAVEHTFGNYSQAGYQTRAINETVEALAAARVARLNYQLTNEDGPRRTTETAIAQVIDAANRSATLFPDANEAHIQRMFAAVGPLASDYRDVFAQQVAATERANALRQQFQEHGFELYTAINEVMTIAREATGGEFGRSATDGELLNHASELAIQFFRSRVRATIFMFNADGAELDGALERISRMEQAYASMLAASAHRPNARATAERIRPMLDRFKSELDQMRTLLGAQAEAERYLQHDSGPRVTAALDEAIQAVRALQTDYGDRTTTQIDQTASFSLMLGIGAVLTGIALAFVIGRWIASAVNAMAASMSKMAGGDLEIAVTGDEYNHELGAMARALKVFQENGRQKLRMDAEAKEAAERELAAAAERAALQAAVAGVVEKAAEGDFAKRVDARYKDEDLNKFASLMNQLLDTVGKGIEETGKVMASLARGDLNTTMQGAFKGGFAELQSNVNGTVRKLRETVLEIQRTSDSMKTATGEIAQGAGDLSSRAENQAASLEEIAATMEQMSATVKTNAENALSASNLSADARSRADKGGAIVDEAVKAMSAIEEGSGKIADIVSVIDGFAFQTNLLALNAAVEAARAGEAGKGFAVVASEVRTLAQRSAEAARDIKNLITESSHQVTDGVRLVEETGTALKEIVDAIRKVSETITEISEASREQSSGVDEITSAITSMDEITQQNSALAEESASAAKGLASQADGLERLMAFFSISGGRSADVEAWDADARADSAAAQAAKAGKAVA
ncbi:MAG: methyl-accepting chemotaxis protein [Rhodobacteraceae bacterium]|nr:MAG: methyl-accepting chemotaxis protein [Paracoccaceae bacterium]